MQKQDLTKLMPYLGALLIFLILSVAYVHPILEGKRLLQPDIVQFEGMAKEIKDFRDDTGEEALWTNSMFGGMPAFQISVIYAHNISNFFHKVITLGLPRPADMLFLYFAGFFVFMLLLKVNVWIAFLGALGFAFSSYHFIIIEAGHNSKALAIGYMAPVLASIIYTFRGKYLAGGILFAIFLALQLFSNHLQITYYLLIIVLFYGLFELIKKIREGEHMQFLKASATLAAAAIIAIGVNIGNFWSTYAYTQHTMRGGTELSSDERPVTSGLDPEYITQWSYGRQETLSLLVPNAKGGASAPLLYEELIAMNQGTPREQREARDIISQYDQGFVEFIIQQLQSGNYINQYWGNQPFTSGPVYLGAVVIFFFVLSLFYVKGPLKWGFLLAIVLSILLAWGKNLMWFTEFFIQYIPGYNKFRAVSMTLVIAELCVPALAFLGMQKWFQKPELLSIRSKAMYWSVGLTAGVLLILYVMPRAFMDFLSQQERMLLDISGADNPGLRMNFAQVEEIRVGIFRADVFRSLGFILAAAALTAFYVSKKIPKAAFVGFLALIIVLDMWPVNRRYFDDSGFVPKRQVENPVQPNQADRFILQQGENARVLDFTASTFNSSRASYFHHSIGGYHGAKLQRYQELIDHHITSEMNTFRQLLSEQQSMENIQAQMQQLRVLNMLNTRYFIYSPEAPPLINPHAGGNVWFAREWHWVDNADQEINGLRDIDPLHTALIDKRFAPKITTEHISYDSLAHIELTHYQPNKLQYRSSAETTQLAVFSEIYYPDGWRVFINGQETEHFRVNYVLRAMMVPPGEHEIEFRFEPRSYYTGEVIALIFSVLLIVLIVGFLYWEIFRKPKTPAPVLESKQKQENPSS